MDEKLNQYLDGVFAPYEGVKSVAELKADLLSDLRERFRELQAEGRDDETAFAMTVDSVGDIEGTVLDAREVNFNGANLTDCNFSITDLTDARFHKSILVSTTLSTSGQGAKFMDVRLIDAKLITTELRTTIFENCIFNGVDFKACDLRGVCFDGQTFADVKFDKSTMNEVSFRGATLKNRPLA